MKTSNLETIKIVDELNDRNREIRLRLKFPELESAQKLLDDLE